MTHDIETPGTPGTDLHLPHACIVCEGPVDLRISPDGARTYCSQCHTLGKPRLKVDPQRGFALEFRDWGLA